MFILDAASELAIDVMTVRTEAGLLDLMGAAAARLGCDYFALSHHVDFLLSPRQGIRVHNYPDSWARRFDEQRLGPSDPIHRASQRTSAAFLWQEAPRWTPVRAGDDLVLGEARRHGIRDGLTIPSHVPGEAHGSVSFAWHRGGPTVRDLPFAGMFGPFAFEAARQIAGPVPEANRPRLTDRQRDIVIWAARGKSDWAIGQILALRPGTVVEHLRNARGRYDAPSRTVLAIRALWDGTISFADIAGR
jgi:LuxR family quorum-sensing system transcriptional regulator CciR